MVIKMRLNSTLNSQNVEIDNVDADDDDNDDNDKNEGMSLNRNQMRNTHIDVDFIY